MTAATKARPKAKVAKRATSSMRWAPYSSRGFRATLGKAIDTADEIEFVKSIAGGS
jgi:hypothetical protein